MPQNAFPWNNPAALRESAQPNIDYNTSTATGNTALSAPNALTGGAVEVHLAMTGVLAAGATATTDTAANIIAAIPQAQRYVGFTYKLRIINESTGAFAWTIAGGTGVTITGATSVAQNGWREYMVKITSLTAVSFQDVGSNGTSQ
jgi:hypothetical protein